MAKKSFNFTKDMELDLMAIKASFLRKGIDLNNTQILEIALLQLYSNKDDSDLIDTVRYNYCD